jgi:subtilisin-like proprotein convertase family protein
MHTTKSPRRRWQLLVAGSVTAAALAASVASPIPAGSQPAPEPTTPPTEVAEPVAEQIAAIQAEKADRSPAEAKVDSNLLYAAAEEAGGTAVPGAPELESTVEVDRSGRTEVDITAEVDADLLDRIEDLGGEVLVSVPGFDAVRAEMPVEAVVELAADGAVRNVVPAGDATTNAEREGSAVAATTTSVGSGANEGVVTHGADEARAAFGIDGEGVKACVLSDGVNSLPARQTSGDIPEVDILPGQAGSGDEGTAMLELIHDIAPGAELGFATAFGSQAGFAQNIIDLRADGCDVIVDDISYFAEGAFQDDDVARAISQVKADGAIYFTAAGNSGNLADGTSGTWQGDFQDAGASTAPLPTGLRVHGWGVGATSNPITLGTNRPITLQWADPLDRSTNDYDLYLLDSTGTSIVAASTTDQTGTQDPYERVTGSAGQKVVVTRDAGAANRYLALFSHRGQLTHVTGGASFGHNSSVDAISTAATPAAAAHQAGAPTGPFPGQHSGADRSELFSSDGPVRSFYGPDGTPLTPGNLSSTGGVVRTGVDITAADGTTTTTPGFTRFFGTSAAAPGAAALAVLALSADPTLRPTELESAMRASALDIEAAGDDPTTGAGIVMAPALLDELGIADAPLVVPAERTITQVTGDGDSAYEPGEVFDIRQELANTGGRSAAGVTATLTSTSPRVSITRASTTYGSIEAGSEATPSGAFRVRILRDCGCGEVLPFTITTSSTDGQPSRTTRFSLAVGSAGAPVKTSYSGPVVPIPDNARTGVTVPFTVQDLGRIQDLTFSLDGTTCSAAVGATTVGLDHAFVGDLVLTLTSPSGTSVPLTVETTNGGNNFCKTVFDDAAGTAFRVTPANKAPFTGSYQPANPLSAFDGEDPEGTWTLKVADTYRNNVGSVRAFSLNIAPTVCDRAANTAPTTAPDPYATSFETPLVVPPNGVLANDRDEDEDPLRASVAEQPDNGTVEMGADGSFTYVPDDGFSGEDTFTYTATDGAVTAAPTTVEITVEANALNSLPTAEADSYDVTAGRPRQVAAPGVLDNDTDADDDPLTVALADDVDHGTLELAADGSFSYTPADGFAGTDSFTYVAQDAEGASSPVTVLLEVSRPIAEPTGGITFTGPTALTWSERGTFTAQMPRIARQPHATGVMELRLEHTDGETVTNTVQNLPLASSRATLKTTDLPVGVTTIQAVYAGDGIYPAVASQPITVEVVRAETATTVASIVPTVPTRGSARFEATTTRLGAARGRIEGTTTFTATAPGHTPVTYSRTTGGSGRAVWVARLPDGDWTVSASFSGTETWEGSSTSAPVTQRVGTPPPDGGGSSAQAIPVSPARVASERLVSERRPSRRRRRLRRA